MRVCGLGWFVASVIQPRGDAAYSLFFGACMASIDLSHSHGTSLRISLLEPA